MLKRKRAVPYDYITMHQSSRYVNDLGHCLPEGTTVYHILRAEPPGTSSQITNSPSLKDCHACPMFSAQWRQVYTLNGMIVSFPNGARFAHSGSTGGSSLRRALLAVTIHDPCRTLSLFGSRY